MQRVQHTAYLNTKRICRLFHLALQYPNVIYVISVTIRPSPLSWLVFLSLYYQFLFFCSHGMCVLVFLRVDILELWQLKQSYDGSNTKVITLCDMDKVNHYLKTGTRGNTRTVRNIPDMYWWDTVSGIAWWHFPYAIPCHIWNLRRNVVYISCSVP